MPTYKAFNLTLDSQVTLPALEFSESSGDDVSIVLGHVNAEGIENPSFVRPFCQVAPGTVWLNVPEIARFLILGGNTIVVNPYPDADEQAIRLYLLGSCMGALLHQREQLVLHASAVRVGDGAIAFAGPSGIGKSTTAAAFLRRGHDILGDDLTVIDDQHCVVPAFPRVKLWEDALEKLSIKREGLDKIRLQINKYSLPLESGFSKAPLPLRALYVLSSHNRSDFDFESLTGLRKFSPLRANTYRPAYIDGLGLSSAHLKRCSKLGGSIRVVNVTRPEHEFELEALVERILEDIALNGQ